MSFPLLPPAVPKRGSELGQKICQTILKKAGWSIEGNFPDISKFVIIGAPHTSNWDFFLAMFAIFSLRLHLNWMAKKSLFRFPIKKLMLWLGGVPIDRNAKHGVVGSMVKTIKTKERMVLGITPEGTRSKVKKWKTGFYHIALGANVPIILCRLDYAKKLIAISAPYFPSGNIENDFPEIQAYFAGIQGKHLHLS